MNPIKHCMVSAEDYPDFRSVSVDGPNMPTDYATFVARVEEFLQGVKDQGGVAAKVYIKPLELAAWCKAQGIPVNSNARAEYAARHDIDSNFHDRPTRG